MSLNTQNTNDYFDPTTDGNVHVAIIGCGAVGSYAGIALGKCGINGISLHDGDVVESKNVQNQAYNLDQVGMQKVDALYELITKSSGARTKPFNQMIKTRKDIKVPKGKPFCVMLLVDSVPARINIMKLLSKMPMCKFVVEAQMGVGACEVNLLYPNKAIPKEWLAHMDMLSKLKPDEVSGCGAPFATSHMSEITGGLVQARLFEALRPNTYVPQCTKLDVRGGTCFTFDYDEYED